MLPPIVQEIVDLIGHSKAMAFIREFGGQELKFPRTGASDSWHYIAEVIGVKATNKLGDTFGNQGYIYIPMCTRPMKLERNRHMIQRYDALLKEGHSARGAVQILVREFRPINHRHVERIVNSPMPEAQTMSAQRDLF